MTELPEEGDDRELSPFLRGVFQKCENTVKILKNGS